MKNIRNTIIKIVVSVALFAFLFTKIDIAVVAENFSRLDWRYVPLILIFFFFNYFIGAIRWKTMLEEEDKEKVTVGYLTSLYFIGAFFNNFMPTSIGGDVYKFVALGNRIGKKTLAFAATFMERFTGMMALVFISYYGMIKTMDFWIGLLPENITSNEGLILGFKILLFTGFWIAAAIGFGSLKFLGKKIEMAKNVYESLIRYKNRKSVLFWAFVTSFIVQFLAIFTQFFIFKALGVDLEIGYSLFVFPVITLASFFIPSLNGLGIQDALYVQFFSVAGVSNELALSASLIYHLFRMVVSLAGGVLYVFKKD